MIIRKFLKGICARRYVRGRAKIMRKEIGLVDVKFFLHRYSYRSIRKIKNLYFSFFHCGKHSHSIEKHCVPLKIKRLDRKREKKTKPNELYTFPCNSMKKYFREIDEWNVR